jgi:N-acetylglucosamine malate deacetylase 1
MSANHLLKLRWFTAGVLSALAAGLLAGAPGRTPAPAAAPAEPAAEDAPAEDGKLRVLCLGAHPDDCELKAAGVAARWAARGHHVKFVSVTNGDVGHWKMAGGPLARRRTAEVERCAKALGIRTEVLDIHDGELLPTLENRKKLVRLIRRWKADVVMGHRPNDYHPDHRNVGLLMQDAAYMVTVPFFCPDTPHLTRNPVFLFYEDGFQKPNPFSPDVVVGIDDVIDKKLLCVELLESQFYEGGCCSELKELPRTAEEKAARKRLVRRQFDRHFASTADRHRAALEKWYGKKAAGIRYAEAFEVCEYGRRPDRDELRKLFPFGPAK